MYVVHRHRPHTSSLEFFIEPCFHLAGEVEALSGTELVGGASDENIVKDLSARNGITKNTFTQGPFFFSTNSVY